MSSNFVVVSISAAIAMAAYYLGHIADKDKFWYWLAGRDYAEKQLEQQVLEDRKCSVSVTCS